MNATTTTTAAHATATATGPAPVNAAEFEAYLPLVHQTVARFLRKLPPNVLRDDLVAAGMIGLIDSLRKHGGERGATFEWYARIRIRGAVVDELRAEDWLSRRARNRVTKDQGTAEKAPSTFVRMDDVMMRGETLDFADSTQMRACEQIEARQGEQALLRAIEDLPPRERFVIRSHYLEGAQMKAIAKELGVSEPRVSQLHARAVQKMRAFMTLPSIVPPAMPTMMSLPTEKPETMSKMQAEMMKAVESANACDELPPDARPTVPARPVRPSRATRPMKQAKPMKKAA